MAMSTPDAPISEVPAISEEEVETHFTISIFFSSKRHVLVWVFLSCFWGKFFFHSWTLAKPEWGRRVSQSCRSYSWTSTSCCSSSCWASHSCSSCWAYHSCSSCWTSHSCRSYWWASRLLDNILSASNLWTWTAWVCLFVLLEEHKTFCFVFFCKMFHKRAKNHLQSNVPPAKKMIQFGRPFFEQQCFCAKNRGNFWRCKSGWGCFLLWHWPPRFCCSRSREEEKTKMLTKICWESSWQGLRGHHCSGQRSPHSTQRQKPWCKARCPFYCHMNFLAFLLPKIQLAFGQTGRICQKLL